MANGEHLGKYADRLNLRQLRATYAWCIDNREWDTFADILTEDAVAVYKPGAIEGREAIVEYARNIGFEYSFHTAQMPRIDVDGDEATGDWYAAVYCVMPDGAEGWVLGTYHDEYRRVSGDWKFSRIESDLTHDTSGAFLD